MSFYRPHSTTSHLSSKAHKYGDREDQSTEEMERESGEDAQNRRDSGHGPIKKHKSSTTMRNIGNFKSYVYPVSSRSILDKIDKEENDMNNRDYYIKLDLSGNVIFYYEGILCIWNNKKHSELITLESPIFPINVLLLSDISSNALSSKSCILIGSKGELLYWNNLTTSKSNIYVMKLKQDEEITCAFANNILSIGTTLGNLHIYSFRNGFNHMTTVSVNSNTMIGYLFTQVIPVLHPKQSNPVISIEGDTSFVHSVTSNSLVRWRNDRSNLKQWELPLSGCIDAAFSGSSVCLLLQISNSDFKVVVYKLANEIELMDSHEIKFPFKYTPHLHFCNDIFALQSQDFLYYENIGITLPADEKILHAGFVASKYPSFEILTSTSHLVYVSSPSNTSCRPFSKSELALDNSKGINNSDFKFRLAIYYYSIGNKNEAQSIINSIDSSLDVLVTDFSLHLLNSMHVNESSGLNQFTQTKYSQYLTYYEFILNVNLLSKNKSIWELINESSQKQVIFNLQYLSASANFSQWFSSLPLVNDNSNFESIFQIVSSIETNNLRPEFDRSLTIASSFIRLIMYISVKDRKDHVLLEQGLPLDITFFSRAGELISFLANLQKGFLQLSSTTFIDQNSSNSYFTKLSIVWGLNSIFQIIILALQNVKNQTNFNLMSEFTFLCCLQHQLKITESIASFIPIQANSINSVLVSDHFNMLYDIKNSYSLISSFYLTVAEPNIFIIQRSQSYDTMKVIHSNLDKKIMKSSFNAIIEFVEKFEDTEALVDLCEALVTHISFGIQFDHNNPSFQEYSQKVSLYYSKFGINFLNALCDRILNNKHLQKLLLISEFIPILKEPLTKYLYHSKDKGALSICWLNDIGLHDYKSAVSSINSLKSSTQLAADSLLLINSFEKLCQLCNN